MLLLTNSQKVTLTLRPEDAFGNPAFVHSVPVWTHSHPTIGTLAPAADGLSAVFTTLGPLGLTQISVTADADPSPTVTTIKGTLDIQVEVGAATTLVILAGAPGPK